MYKTKASYLVFALINKSDSISLLTPEDAKKLQMKITMGRAKNDFRSEALKHYIYKFR